MALPATYIFPGTPGVGLSASWTYASTVSTIKNDTTAGDGTVNSANTDAIAWWNADAFGNNHYSQIQTEWTGTGTGTDYVYLVARATGTGSGTVTTQITAYWFWSDGGSDTTIIKSVSGTQTPLVTANATTFAAGDVFRLICNGSTISVNKNGSQIMTVTDSSIASGGAAGMGGFGGIGTVKFSHWQGDNVGAAATIPPGLGPSLSMVEPLTLPIGW